MFTPRLNDSGIRTSPLYTTDNPFYNAGYGMPNCTAYAWARFYEEGEPQTRPRLSTGNAEDWYNYNDGYTRGNTPKLGAILCLANGPYSGDGHVCIVEQINSDGSIVTSNSAYGGTFFYLETRTPPYYNTEGYDYQGFIYNPNVNTIKASPYVVAAMCGCWWRESQVNPAIWESLIPSTFDHEYQYDGIGGYGLGQWTNVGTPYGRLWNLHEWVTNNGYTDGDGDGQLAYINVENYWSRTSPRLGYTTLSQFIESSSTSLSDLVYDFLACWEGIEGDAYYQRLSWARQCYNYIEEHQNDEPSTYQWISGNRYLSESETLNNVMVVWFWFSNQEPVPPLPKKKTFIMYINKRKFMRKRGLLWR